MNRRSKRKKKEERDERGEMAGGELRGLKPETKRSVLAIFFFIGSAIFVLSYIGKGGQAGGFIFQLFESLLGRGYFFAPLALILVGFSLIFSRAQKIVGATLFGGALFLISSLTSLHVVFGSKTGGFLGAAIGTPLMYFFDFWASLVIAFGLLFVSILLMLDLPLLRRKEIVAEDEIETEEKKPEEEVIGGLKTALENLKTALVQSQSSGTIQTPIQNNRAVTIEEGQKPLSLAGTEESKEESLISVRKLARKSGYKKPPLELLHDDKGSPSSGDIRANMNIIKRTLDNFGIKVEMAEVSVGPTVTQYTLRPAEGVKLSKITALHNDISLALAAHPIRIEAPIPGKSLVGVEVPNRSIALVGLKALLSSKTFQETPSPLLLALGRDVTGSPVFADLSRMPHLLISGATGAGKSVSIHTIVVSLLYRNPPETLRFILVDPKRVELSVYNDISHLLTPVITDPKKTIQALRWATKEMDRRYDLLSAVGARDIISYNNLQEKLKNEAAEILPYIVIIIDELADLMAMFPREVEGSIIRLAQMARAVGIHLIVATQRPSVEVITGLIKANITSRIAFQVASQIDSRTILDMAGAEKLLGNGDMLFLAGDTSKPRRIQGAFVSEQEVKRVVDFLREAYEVPEYEYENEILETKIDETQDSEESFGDDDPLYNEAVTVVVQAGKASASYLQRRLRIGYARAARLLDLMEARGVVGPADGAKPREILIKNSQPLNSSEIEDKM
jgi:S-DNA-T family DNA segregation ATPase FtsK/SpoIIIE